MLASHPRCTLDWLLLGWVVSCASTAVHYMRHKSMLERQKPFCRSKCATFVQDTAMACMKLPVSCSNRVQRPPGTCLCCLPSRLPSTPVCCAYDQHLSPVLEAVHERQHHTDNAGIYLVRAAGPAAFEGVEGCSQHSAISKQWSQLCSRYGTPCAVGTMAACTAQFNRLTLKRQGVPHKQHPGTVMQAVRSSCMAVLRDVHLCLELAAAVSTYVQPT